MMLMDPQHHSVEEECPLGGFFLGAPSPLFSAHPAGATMDEEQCELHQYDTLLFMQQQQQHQQAAHLPPKPHMQQPHAINNVVVPGSAPPQLSLGDSFESAPATMHIPPQMYAAPQQQVPQTVAQWSNAHHPTPTPSLEHDHSCSASSRASTAGSVSGHSTPTLSAATSPVSVQRPPTSLLEQLSCMVPEITAPAGPANSALANNGVKAKREKRITVKREKASPVQPRSPDDSNATLPTFVSRMDSAPHSSAPFAAPPRVMDQVRSVAPPSPAPENNEPHPSDDEATKKLKLARKAELARLSRKRKKTRLSDLEAEVRHLEEELHQCKKGRLDEQEANAQAALAAMDVAADNLTQQKLNDVIAAMTVAVHQGLAQPEPSTQVAMSQRTPALTGADAPSRAHPTVLTPLIDEFMLLYNQQASNCAKHLATLQEHHVKPMRTFEFLNTLLRQSHESSANWSTLVSQELCLSSGSRELSELDGFRTSLAGQHSFDGEIERAFQKLQSLVQKRQTQQAKNLNRIRSIFSEQQFVKYVEWSHRAQHQQQQQQPPHQHSQQHVSHSRLVSGANSFAAVSGVPSSHHYAPQQQHAPSQTHYPSVHHAAPPHHDVSMMPSADPHSLANFEFVPVHLE